MKLKEALTRLEALGTERMRKQNVRHGSGDNQYGVQLGDVAEAEPAVPGWRMPVDELFT